MVLLNVKLSEDDQFFYATTCTANNNDLRRELVSLQNARKRLQLVVLEAGELVKFGPIKDELVEEELVNHIQLIQFVWGGRGGRQKRDRCVV
jgi:hypothetical protein